ncbi:MAG: GPR endopeptidase [Clostridiales bacterium]|nr:GPR endopeptidase [Clostridiales bacterium]
MPEIYGLNNMMKFKTDMALDVFETAELSSVIAKTQIAKNILKSKIEIDNEKLSQITGRKQGSYVTYDIDGVFFTKEGLKGKLIKRLAAEIKDLSPKGCEEVLFVGLGNEGLIADSLGAKALEFVNSTRHGFKGRGKVLISKILPGVYGETGIETFDTVKAVAEKIKPSLIIAVDTLITSKPKRLYSSFQLSTAGIEPGSGLGARRKGLSQETLGCPVLAIGVPLVCDIRAVIFETLGKDAEKYMDKISCVIPKNLVVAPKEIDIAVRHCAEVIGLAVNYAYSV